MKIHAFIISWSGKEEEARKIAASIQGHVDKLTVIHSDRTNSTRASEDNWVLVPDEWFFGKKFEESLKRFSEDVMLLITADASYNSWPELVSRCREAHTSVKNIGIWAPVIDYSPWNTKKLFIAEYNKTGLNLVAHTDSIVWSISSSVANRLREFNYDTNNLGWGVDLAAISYSTSHNLLVIRDDSIVVKHPKGSAYDRNYAHVQMKEFLAQLSPQEKVQYLFLINYVYDKSVSPLYKILKKCKSFLTSRSKQLEWF